MMTPTRYSPVLLLAFLLWSGCATQQSIPAGQLDLANASIQQLQDAMASGELTSRELVSLYLQRIDALDQNGPAINSILQINPEALTIADALDRERHERGPRGPLHGIPILLKDNIDTADQMETTAGSLALLGTRPERDAFIVERLREAGAVILGKTNLSEWANFRSTKSSSGWSARGGQARNPYALDRNTSGSSSGSGSAVAAGFAAASVGTETDGSIVSPASHTGIVGVKPTVGLLSRSGIIPIAGSQDTAGPMARSVRDAAILLGAMSGVDPRDRTTAASEGRKHADYTQFLRADALRGKRIGVLRSPSFGFPATVSPVLEASIEALRRAGAEVIEVEMPTLGQYFDSEYEVLLYEFRHELNAFLAARPGSQVRSLEELIEFNRQNAERQLPYFGQEILEMAATKGPLTDEAYLEALAKNHQLSREKGIDAVLTGHSLDALVAITNGPAHLIDLVNGDAFTGGSSTVAAVSGYPSITVPAGYVRGLPIGLSFFAEAWSEPKLLALAYAFEQETMVRRAPEFRPTAEIPAAAYRRQESP
jgi:amidase